MSYPMRSATILARMLIDARRLNKWAYGNTDLGGKIYASGTPKQKDIAKQLLAVIEKIAPEFTNVSPADETAANPDG
jgi:hypothetical protein